MAIKFKVIEKGKPGVSGGGEKKFYASANITGEKTLAGLTRDIEKVSTVSGADIRAVLYALVDVMKSALEEGQAVRLGELGSMRINISSKGEMQEKDVNSSSITGAKVLFTPSAELKKMLNDLKYEKL
ncbi:DNA-binding protein [Porphyromonadaceae bacterium COT-184 OH4590]|nr:DNA-binding protein [Porphyromonadaceae bacterium COT-184 OH4590]MDO4725640.1 HU family DNA-binding protein [Porphyromonadaceae bacterium]